MDCKLTPPGAVTPAPAGAAGTTGNQQVTTREAYVAYTGGNGDPASNLTVTGGLFALPFGYILPVSSATYLTPERPLAFGEGSSGLFNIQDYDKGLQVSYNVGQQLSFLPAGLKLTAALVNGTGRTSDATDKFRDQVYRVAYQTPNKVVSIGGSYYLGQVGVPAVTGNLIGPGTTGDGLSVYRPEERTLRRGCSNYAAERPIPERGICRRFVRTAFLLCFADS